MRAKKTLWIAAASVVLTAAYLLLFTREELPLRVINGLSLAGVIDICAGLLCHVRNSGQFRLLSYGSYNRHKKDMEKDMEEGVLPKDTETPSFHEYTTQKYEKKWDAVPFYICGGPLILLSLALLPLLS